MSHPKKKGRIAVHDEILRLVVLAMLLAVGYALMLFGKIQPYPMAGFLEIEVSDAIVLVAYSLYGFWASLAVSIGKTLLLMLTFGPVGSPIPIGNLTALLTSLCYSFLLLVFDKVFHIFSKNRWFRYLGYLLIILIETFVLTLLNYLFITPTFLTYGAKFLTFKDIKAALADASSSLYQTFHDYFSASAYETAILVLYVPFNLIKGTLVCLVYEVIFNRVIFQLLKSGRFSSKVFLSRKEAKDLEAKKEDKNPS